jgi:hypothetical protein
MMDIEKTYRVGDSEYPVMKNVEVPMVLSEIPRERRRARALDLLRSVWTGAQSRFQPSKHLWW